MYISYSYAKSQLRIEIETSWRPIQQKLFSVPKKQNITPPKPTQSPPLHPRSSDAAPRGHALPRRYAAPPGGCRRPRGRRRAAPRRRRRGRCGDEPPLGSPRNWWRFLWVFWGDARQGELSEVEKVMKQKCLVKDCSC